MRELTIHECEQVSGGDNIFDSIGNGLGVIWDAFNGDAPGPDVLTGTATGPTPGGVGGRYPESARDMPASANNMPGGELGRAIGRLYEDPAKKKKSDS